MKIPDEHKNIPTQCYVNGHLKTLSFEEAYILFWEVPFAWLEPLNWLRYGEHNAYVKDLMGPSIKIFAYNLLTRGYMPLTIDSECMLDEHGYAPNRNNFQAKACRLAKLFKEYIPFIYDEVFDNRKKLIPAYRILPESRWAIVVGIAPDHEIQTTEMNWTIFQAPERKKR
jgi:hypothetical protein